MSKKWYAVQNGDNYASDYGSTRKAEAVKMARTLCKSHYYDGEEIRISICTVDSDFCLEEIIVRDGDR